MVTIVLLFIIFASYSISKVSADDQNTEAQLQGGEICFQELKNKVAQMRKRCFITEEEKSSEKLFLMETEDDLRISESENSPEKVYDLPKIPTSVKLFTDYRVYNLWYTPHYRLQQAAWTDDQGFRRYNDDYIVALGSYYSTDIGDRFEVTLDTDKTFTIIFGDGKVNEDCDSENMYTPCFDYNGDKAANVLEFIIDEEVLDRDVYDYGSVDLIEEFKGDITKMVYLGRDASQDWDLYEVKGE